MNIISAADNSAYRIKEQERNKIPSKNLAQTEQYKRQKAQDSQEKKVSEKRAENIQNQNKSIQRQEQLNSTNASKQTNTLSFAQKEDSIELSQKGLDLLKQMQIQSIEVQLEFSQY